MDAGLLYRAEKLVNWSPCLQSALSDMEVTHIEIEPHQMFDVPGFNKPVELGVMVDIAYKAVLQQRLFEDFGGGLCKGFFIGWDVGNLYQSSTTLGLD